MIFWIVKLFKISNNDSRYYTESEIDIFKRYCEPSNGAIPIENYNSKTNYFTCPSDGYIFVNSWGGHYATIHTVSGFKHITQSGQQTVIFVKKGCRIYLTLTGQETLQVHFIPCIFI